MPLLGAVVDRVDAVKAQAALEKLRAKHPDATPAQLAQRLMAEKAWLAGSSELATSFLPGAAIAFLAVDLAAVAELQAEMVFQIPGPTAWTCKRQNVAVKYWPFLGSPSAAAR